MAVSPNRFALRPATMVSVSTPFAVAGRLAVRFRWAIVLAWVAGTVAAMTLLPSLSNVTQSDNTSFLPASAPSERAAQLASPLQGASLTAVTVVAARAERAADRGRPGGHRAAVRRAGAGGQGDLGAGRRPVRRRPGRAVHGAGRAGPVRRAGHLPAGQPGGQPARGHPDRGAARRAGGAYRGLGGDPGGHQRDLEQDGRPGPVVLHHLRDRSAHGRVPVGAGTADRRPARPGRGAGRRAADRRGGGPRAGRVADRLAAADRARARRGDRLRAVPDVPGAGGDAGRAGLGGSC